MNYNCHKLGGVTAATITGIYAYQNGVLDEYSFSLYPSNLPQASYIIPLLLLLTFSYYSSTLPDIDHPMSRLGKQHPHISHYINSHYGHRGVTHYPLTLIVIGSGLYFISQILIFPYSIIWMWGSIGFVVGYASHILLDTLNSAGVSLLAPLSRVRVKIPTGISIRKVKGKRKVCWRYLKGGKAIDDFILILICGSLIGVMM